MEIVAQDKEIEVAPGVKYEAWTYNGRVPGPTLRGSEGELLRIRFVNASEHPHTMHFHGVLFAWCLKGTAALRQASERQAQMEVLSELTRDKMAALEMAMNELGDSQAGPRGASAA